MSGTFSGTGTGSTFKSWKDTDFNFTFAVNSTPRIISSGGSSVVTVADHTVTRTTSTSYWNDQQINLLATIPSQFAPGAVVFSSSNSGVATVDQNGKVTQVANGAVKITMSTPILTRAVNLTLTQAAGQSVDTFLAYNAGTMSLSDSTAVDSRIASLTSSSTTRNMWSTRNDSIPSYVWNTACWAYGLDMTCISPWNSTGGNTKSGTLISPRHIIFATHFPISDGATIRFVKQDGTLVSRTMAASATSVGGTDIAIGILSSDVPSGISFASILPSSYAANLPSLNHLFPIPALATNQAKEAFVLDFFNVDIYANYGTPTDTKRLSFSSPIITGDSGSPAFLIINGNLALMSCWNFGGNTGAGPLTSDHISAINTKMHDLSVGQSAGTDYQLTTTDLSGFTSF